MNNEVRVFISSIFSDLEHERTLLHTVVRLTLEEMCAHFGLAFALSDLRWGVTRSDLAHDRTAELCLREVEVCRERSPEANILALLGDRAGSRVLPPKPMAQALSEPLRVCRRLQLLRGWSDDEASSPLSP